jgi:hypothetical protein
MDPRIVHSMKYVNAQDSIDFHPERLQRYQSMNDLIPDEPYSNEYSFGDQKILSTTKRMIFIRKVLHEIKYLFFYDNLKIYLRFTLL